MFAFKKKLACTVTAPGDRRVAAVVLGAVPVNDGAYENPAPFCTLSTKHQTDALVRLTEKDFAGVVVQVPWTKVLIGKPGKERGA